MKRNNNGTLQTMILTALVMSLVFLMTKVVQIPTFSGGYIHLGDCMVLLSVIILGWKLGALASGVGAAMSDLAGGYGIYVPGTFAVKALMALVFGLVVERAIKKDLSKGAFTAIEVVGMILALLVNVVGYFLYAGFLYGNWPVALTEVPMNVLQTSVGIVLALALQQMFEKTPLRKSLVYRLPVQKEINAH